LVSSKTISLKLSAVSTATLDGTAAIFTLVPVNNIANQEHLAVFNRRVAFENKSLKCNKTNVIAHRPVFADACLGEKGELIFQTKQQYMQVEHIYQSK
jgi:hypothetical protein